MATLIYALQNFTATDGTVCTKGNTYSVREASAMIAQQQGLAQPAESGKDPYGNEGQKGQPYSFATRTLRNTDCDRVLIPSDNAQTATIPSGLVLGFGCAFNNNITISAGSGVTLTDKRSTGATNPTCAIVCTGTNTYEVWGSKT